MTEDMLPYREAVDYLMDRINYERLGAEQYSSYDLKLDRMRTLLDVLGNPQDELPAVHIAGTKGKGSTSIMTASILTAAGYRVGLFTSPHLSRLEERMTINGRPPSEPEVVRLVGELQAAVRAVDAQGEFPPVTYFEILTAMAWRFFVREQVDIVVLEVGLGGRLDSTNVCRPDVTVITSISYDHMHILGTTLDRIAREKAGILKAGVPLVSGVTQLEPSHAIEEIAAERGVRIVQLGRDFRYEYRSFAGQPDLCGELGGLLNVTAAAETISGIYLPVLGAHQGHNAAMAVAAVLQLRDRGWRLPDGAVAAGLQSVTCPVRMEVIRTNPITILDAAHNMASIRACAETLEVTFSERRKHLIFATTKDKPVEEMLAYLLPRFDRVVLTQYLNNPRRFGVHELAAAAQNFSGGEFAVAEHPAQAWQTARQAAAADDVICVTGSFFIAAELREFLLASEPASAACHPPATTVAGPV